MWQWCFLSASNPLTFGNHLLALMTSVLLCQHRRVLFWFSFSLLKEVETWEKSISNFLNPGKWPWKMTLPLIKIQIDCILYQRVWKSIICFFLLSVVDRFSYFLNVGGGNKCLAMASYLQLEQTVDCWKFSSHWLLKTHIDLRGYLHSWLHFLFYWSLLDLQGVLVSSIQQWCNVFIDYSI